MANNPNKIAGVCFCAVNSVNFTLSGDCKYSVNQTKRETLVGRSEVNGFAETPVAPYIEIEIRDMGNLLMSDIAAWDNVNVVLNLANGKTVTGNGLWTTEPQEVDTAESKATVRFEGRALTEIPSIA